MKIQGRTTVALQAAFQRSCAKWNAVIFPEPQGTGVLVFAKNPSCPFLLL